MCVIGYVSVCMCIFIFSCLYSPSITHTLYTHIPLYTYIHTNIYTYIYYNHTYNHTYIHIYIQVLTQLSTLWTDIIIQLHTYEGNLQLTNTNSTNTNTTTNSTSNVSMYTQLWHRVGGYMLHMSLYNNNPLLVEVRYRCMCVLCICVY